MTVSPRVIEAALISVTDRDAFRRFVYAVANAAERTDPHLPAEEGGSKWADIPAPPTRKRRS